ncbi:hypothetical protein ACHAQA_003032 [Verticillium albo-atrum]
MAVTIDSMPQLAEANCPDDDWTGLRDRAERKKRQTRLNVRAHRKRKAQAQAAMFMKDYYAQPAAPSARKFQPSHKSGHGDMLMFTICGDNFRPLSFDPTQDNFPLSTDHLIPLIQYNVKRASHTNIAILAITTLVCIDSPYKTMPLFPYPHTIPETLKPTPLQQNTPHPPWIDILPSPRMRDNAIRALNRFAPVEFCHNLAGTNAAVDGIIAWSDPWAPDGWEVTEGMLRKWPFLFEDCEDMRSATNRWRARRNEPALVWEVA